MFRKYNSVIDSGHMKKNLYCGIQSLSLKDLIKKDNPAFFTDNNTIYFHKTRIAIRYACHLLNIGKGDIVLAPSYNCGTEIDALLKSGASIELYNINKKAQIDIDDLKRRITKNTKLIYITHYFGFPQSLAEIKKICLKRNIFLIEDCALSLFSGSSIGTIGDISVFNFPKTLPVPDGGALVINNPEIIPEKISLKNPPMHDVAKEMLILIKRSLLSTATETGLYYPSNIKKNKQDILDNKNINKYPDIPANYYYNEQLTYCDISGISKHMINKFNSENVIKIRRANFQKYIELLRDIDGVDLLYNKIPSGICPLYFPVIVKQRDIVSRMLNDFSIDSIAFWAGYHKDLNWSKYHEACYLKNNLLALPVHQQLNEKHINYIADKLKTIICKIVR